MERWFVKNIKPNKQIESKFGISEFVGKIIASRNITDEESVKKFINPNIENLRNPRKMKDIDKAVKIIKEKIANKSKIRIIGDYDIDGIMSTYSLFTGFERCGANVDYDIPDRITDGYGINTRLIDKAKEEGIDTIITCDNGISAIEPIKYAKKMGLTVIVTDHHDVPFTEDDDGERTFILPDADCVINPKRKDCEYEFKELCGAGVAYKLVQVLYEEMGIDESECHELIEFVSIATVCDVVDLVDENRIFVKNGLEMINNTSNTGLESLIRATGIEDKNISVYHLGFVIGPCMNASGRLGSAKRSIELLLSEDLEESDLIAKELNNLNEKRKDMTKKGVEKAIEIVENNNLKEDKVLVIYVPDLHESLAGIVAGRVKDKYNKPTIVLTVSESGAKGSGRSIEEYNMFEELLKCEDLLLRFGGHPMAGGLSLQTENIEPLREKLNKVTTLTAEDLKPKVSLDTQLPLDFINYKLIDELEMLQPFGKGNSKPLFGDKNIEIIKASILGKNKNVLKLRILTQNKKHIDGIYFGDIENFDDKVINRYGRSELDKLYQGAKNDVSLDMAFNPDTNTYNGRTSIQLVIKNFR